MTFNSIKTTVHRISEQNVFSKYDETTNHVNKILAGILTIDVLQKLMKYDTAYNTDASALTKEYFSTLKNISESLKGKYISYKLIYNKIVDWKVPNIMAVNQNMINQVISLYENKEVIKDFSTSYFSQYMYNITGLNDKELTALNIAHNRVFIPIVEYYISNFKIRNQNVSLDADLSGFKGKTIKLSIDGIKNARIFADIDRDIFGIKEYIYKYSMTSDGFVKIILK